MTSVFPKRQEAAGTSGSVMTEGQKEALVSRRFISETEVSNPMVKVLHAAFFAALIPCSSPCGGSSKRSSPRGVQLLMMAASLC